MRNATVTTIAPTGTISMICGASSGVEPIFAVAYTKNVMDGTSFVEVNPLFEHYAEKYEFSSNGLLKKIAETGSVKGLAKVPQRVQEIFITAQEIEPEWHIRIQAVFQKYTDNAVSKTINFANEAIREDIAQAYLLAYELNCKGLTVYRDGSRDEQVLSTGIGQRRQKEKQPSLHPEAYNTIVPRPRPEVTMGVTEKIKIGCGNLYVSVNADEQGICEVFTNTGRAGGCSSQSEATARLISIALRSGLAIDALIEQMRGIRCSACIRREGVKVTSCPDAISGVIQKYMDKKFSNVVEKSSEYIKDIHVKELTKKMQTEAAVGNTCPECGMPINHESGCIVCTHCGYSKCG